MSHEEEGQNNDGYLADCEGWVIFNIYITCSRWDSMPVLAENADTVFKRAARRLSCSMSEVRFCDRNLRPVSHAQIQNEINLSGTCDYYHGFNRVPLKDLYAFIAGQKKNLASAEENFMEKKLARVGVVIGERLDIVSFSNEAQLLDYIAERLHCNARSEFMLFTANQKLLKVKSKVRPPEKYCKTPYLIAYINCK